MKAYAQKLNQPQKQSLSDSTRSRAKPLSAGRVVHPIMHLQRMTGNQAVQRVPYANLEALKVVSDIPAHSKTHVKLQMKFKVNTPGDVYEQEADRIAEQVTSMPEPQLRRSCACGGGCPGCQRDQADHQQVQTKPIQAKGSEEIAAPPIVNEVLRSSGQPLDGTTQRFMESRFGHDFSQVRVHTDARAAESARAVNALAYTAGRDVVFGVGQYQPKTTEGKRLLAHELTHSIQQTTVFPAKSAINRPAGGYGPGADARALVTSRGVSSPFYGQTGVVVMRQLIEQPKAREPEEDENEKKPRIKVANTFNYQALSSDLKELKNLNISGSKPSASSDVQALSNAIRTLRSVTKKMDTFSISQRSAQNIKSKVSTLNNILSSADVIQLGLGKQQTLLGSVAVMPLAGVEPIGWLVVLEVLGEIVAAIAAILEAPIVIIIAVVVLVIWLIYEIIKAYIEEVDRALCILLYPRCLPPSPCRDCLGICINNDGEWPFDKCPIPK